MERNDAIITLEVLRANCSKHSRDYQALDYAISSLKTDEAYQIMYEGGEIFTKADMVAMLEELKKEIEKLKNEPACCQHYKRGVNRSSDVIQQKIDNLKENTNDTNTD